MFLCSVLQLVCRSVGERKFRLSVPSQTCPLRLLACVIHFYLLLRRFEYIVITRLDHRHIGCVAVSVDEPQVTDLFPSAIVVAKCYEGLISGVNKCELVEPLWVVSSSAASIDETALVSIVDLLLWHSKTETTHSIPRGLAP